MQAWREPRWLLGRTPANHSGLAQIACFAMCRDTPGEDTLPWVSWQMRKCGGWSLLSNFDDEHLGVRRIHPGYNITRYKKVDPSITRGTSSIVTLGTWCAPNCQPGCRLNFEIGLFWVAQATPAFDWYVNIDPDVVFFPELLPAFFAHYGPKGGVVGANWLPMGSFALSRSAVLTMVDPSEGWQKSCRLIPRIVRNMDQHLAHCMKISNVPYCSANKSNPFNSECMPNGKNCSFPYGPWLGVFSPAWYNKSEHYKQHRQPPWRQSMSMAEADIHHDMFDDFMGGGACAGGVVGFHPVKDKTSHIHMLHRFYRQNRLGIVDALHSRWASLKREDLEPVKCMEATISRFANFTANRTLRHHLGAKQKS